MNDEDTDWKVYHLIPPCGLVTKEVLSTESGLALSVIEESIARLVRSCLVEYSGNAVRMLSFGEALIRNQVKYEPGLPFTIENGVIKEKKR